jgi:outer membrane protein OmpA-like peptidoglycan-associated protein
MTFLFATLLLAACNTLRIDGGGPAAVDDRAVFRKEHSNYLERGYFLLSEYEGYIEHDEIAAQHFKEKYKLAHRGRRVLPDQPVSDEASLTEGTDGISDEIGNGHEMLEDAFEVLAIVPNSGLLAEAQVNYDCWLERISDENVSASDKHASLCKKRFYSALGDLKRPASYVSAIYFDVNETILKPESKISLQNVLANFPQRGLWRIYLTGYTDKSGDYDSNVVLSMRRALAVRNMLAQYGIEPEKIIINASGEIGSGAASGENDEGSQSRRVDISIAPVYMKNNNNGPDIKELLPHFFSANDDV